MGARSWYRVLSSNLKFLEIGDSVLFNLYQVKYTENLVAFTGCSFRFLFLLTIPVLIF